MGAAITKRKKISHDDCVKLQNVLRGNNAAAIVTLMRQLKLDFHHKPYWEDRDEDTDEIFAGDGLTWRGLNRKGDYITVRKYVENRGSDLAKFIMIKGLHHIENKMKEFQEEEENDKKDKDKDEK